MPRVDLRNILILIGMAVVGFYATTYVVRRYGD
jgi:hypothetical protein